MLMTNQGLRTLLIVEDNELNREILHDIFEENYHVICAENGKVGLELLQQNYKKISLVLLDIQMPVLNGYEFLEEVKKNDRYSGIPIIVMTANDTAEDEIRCLEIGASDFVTKPYNPDIVLKRVKSMIRLKETSSIIARVERDTLTGVYTKEFFFEYAGRILQDNPDQEFDMICSNIDSFKMINNRYGESKGDELLCYISRQITECFNSPREICGRIGGDIFAVLIQHQDIDTIDYKLKKLLDSRKKWPISNAMLQFGIYQQVDKSLSVQTICNNARMAITDIKGQYGEYKAVYSEDINSRQLREQAILDDMDEALAEHQFQVYYQSKFDLEKGKIGGAEALVRWIHPEYGFMNPGEFIPLFERRGFIIPLDFYVWERVCIDLRRWIDEGKHSVVPISINISRRDFDLKDLDERIGALVDQYRIPHSLIHLEVTESAYSDDPKHIAEVVDKLRANGFKIEIDDFGSGYSSLNMLEDLNFDVLKIDMSLVRKIGTEYDKKSIVAFIFNLTEFFDVNTVAEGVETLVQAEILKKLGCTYAQGYYYSRPVPVDQFEALLVAEQESAAKKEDPSGCKA